MRTRSGAIRNNTGSYENQPGESSTRGNRRNKTPLCYPPSGADNVDYKHATITSKSCRVGGRPPRDLKNENKKPSDDIFQHPEVLYKAKLKKGHLFYNIKVVKDSNSSKFYTWIKYGEILSQESRGDGSQNDAINIFRDIFKEMTDLGWENCPDKAIDDKYVSGTGREPVQELMQLIFNEEGFNKAKEALNPKGNREFLEIDDIELKLKSLAKEAAVARKKHKNQTKAKTYKANETQKEVEQFRGLWASRKAYEVMYGTYNFVKEVHRLYGQLTPLCKGSDEFETLTTYLHNHGSTFRCQLKDIFRINHEEQRGSRSSNRRLLWHGSRSVNYCSILIHGLQIPPPSGPLSKMLGNGIYLTDKSLLAATYCKTTTDALLLLCEVELPEENDTLNVRRPIGWIDAEKVHKTLQGVQMPGPETNTFTHQGSEYNTYTCYDPTQIKLRYIFRLDICGSTTTLKKELTSKQGRRFI